MLDSPLSLHQYLSVIKEVIHLSFEDAVWVKAEIRNLSIKAGNYYLELAEKEQESDKVIANCKAMIWKFTAKKIVLKFERESGIELDKDVNVLIKVKARFDPQYGFSMTIEDIDSSYTLGDIARRYQQILTRLTDEGLVHLNQALPTPFDIHQVLVLTPENAAGLGDFKKDADALAHADVCQFTYCTATFQGHTASTSMIEALRLSLHQWVKTHTAAPDLIVIIRGGGAVNDLAYLNDYDLAALLCKRTVPIWVGIGHEKDRTILDEIAHKSFDTPSKVIAAIRNLIFERTREVLDHLNTIKLLSQHQLVTYQSQNDQLIHSIKAYSHNQTAAASKQLDTLKSSIHYAAQQQVKQATIHIESLMRETLLQNPKHILAKGYAIVRNGHQAIRSVQHVQSPICIEMHDGFIQARIDQVIPHE